MRLECLLKSRFNYKNLSWNAAVSVLIADSFNDIFPMMSCTNDLFVFFIALMNPTLVIRTHSITIVQLFLMEYIPSRPSFTYFIELNDGDWLNHSLVTMIPSFLIVTSYHDFFE